MTRYLPTKYLLTLSVGLHPGCGVDGVAEEAVPRHLQPHHGRAARAWSGDDVQSCAKFCKILLVTCVDTYPQLEAVSGPVADLEGLDGVQEAEGHPGNLHRVPVSVTDGETWPHRETCITNNNNKYFYLTQRHKRLRLFPPVNIW